jgi:hypothetical protein
MMPNDPLQQLKDIHLPNPVSIFPLAMVWYVAMLLFAILTIALLIWTIHKYRKGRQIKSIYQLLNDIEQNMPDDMLTQTSILIKRVAVMKFPLQKPHTLFGEEWLTFLDNTGKTNQFTQGYGRHLLDIYQMNKIEEPKQFFAVMRQWIRTVL